MRACLKPIYHFCYRNTIVVVYLRILCLYAGLGYFITPNNLIAKLGLIYHLLFPTSRMSNSGVAVGSQCRYRLPVLLVSIRRISTHRASINYKIALECMLCHYVVDMRPSLCPACITRQINFRSGQLTHLASLKESYLRLSP